MKKSNKLFISLGTIIVAALPIVTISCYKKDSQVEDKNDNKDREAEDKNDNKNVTEDNSLTTRKGIINNMRNVFVKLNEIYKNDIMSQYQPKQNISEELFNKIKTYLSDYINLIKSDLLSKSDKSRISRVVQDENYKTILESEYITIDECDELWQSNEDPRSQINNPTNVMANIEYITSGQGKSLTRVDFAFLLDFLEKTVNWIINN
ncbi:variable surface lipoprotein [Metamycoplasma neophronis]|uniref:Variable surface lipoprotein n=1 Tax=Metamycoplasma neophronis TaxID=872983 RepID=A0ABY2YZB3_9BACT|nr:variable surface lipoprotein [Metamycoplasma neophronis]TPR53372.1 variable surface lipoprotein [Metamycoplasma neophronis]